jgi:hypothetical protein
VNNFGPDHVFYRTIRVRRVIGGKCMCEFSNGLYILSSVTVRCHRKIQNQWERWKTIVFSVVKQSNPWSQCSFPPLRFFDDLFPTEKKNVRDRGMRYHVKTKMNMETCDDQRWTLRLSSCPDQENDTYKKIYKVDPWGSSTKQSRKKKKLIKRTRVQTTHKLTKRDCWWRT